MNPGISLVSGQSISIIFPSGKIINIECTKDTASIVYERQVLFNENLVLGSWQQDWPPQEEQSTEVHIFCIPGKHVGPVCTPGQNQITPIGWRLVPARLENDEWIYDPTSNSLIPVCSLHFIKQEPMN